MACWRALLLCCGLWGLLAPAQAELLELRQAHVSTMRDGALQDWPELSIMWRTPRSTALSSASAKIPLAPLPPSSSVTRFSVSAAALLIARPARVEPVKEIIATSG
mgnify:CR=1 FL=1